MNNPAYQHEVIVPNQGFPFKLFLFEGNNGKYLREKHWHRSIEIFAVQEGSLEFILNEKQYPLETGNFIIVNSNEVHAVRAPRPNRTIVLQIPVNLFSAYYTEEQFIWFSHGEKTYDSQVTSMMFELFRLYTEQKIGYELQMMSLFYQLQYLLVTKYRKLEVHEDLLKSNKQLKRLGVITSYLKEHYKEDITLEKMAGIFGYSPSYLSRMFMKYAKINYKDYLQSVRLEHALLDLQEIEKEIGEIALEHGFPNSKALSNLFRKRYGILPNEFRKQIKKTKK